MTSREAILGSLRSRTIPPIALPALDLSRAPHENPAAQFEEVLEAVGGSCRHVADRAALREALDELGGRLEAEKVVSQVDGVARANVDLNEIADPHDLHDVDLAILNGSFAVAENAAIWLDLNSVKHRVICVLSQHLAIVLPRDAIVETLHEAYPRIQAAASERQLGFGLFLSGPSKTADIEQTLVIGAHGARSLNVFLVGE